jgi:hypothetical protein
VKPPQRGGQRGQDGEFGAPPPGDACAVLIALPVIIDWIVIKTVVVVISWVIRAVYDWRKDRNGGERGMKRVVAMGLLFAAAGLIAGCGSGRNPSASGTHSASAVAAKSPTAAPQVADQEGQTCAAFDSTGFCPGDDPMTCDTVDAAGPVASVMPETVLHRPATNKI